MWDLRTRRCKVIFTGHSKAVTCLTALREDGSNLILSGSKVRQKRHTEREKERERERER